MRGERGGDREGRGHIEWNSIGREEGLPLRVMWQRGFLPEMASSTKSLIKGGGCSTRDTCRGTYHTIMRRSFGSSNTTFTPSVGRGNGELGPCAERGARGLMGIILYE